MTAIRGNITRSNMLKLVILFLWQIKKNKFKKVATNKTFTLH